MLRKLKIQNLLLSAASILLTWLFLELVLFRFFLPHVPLKLQYAVGKELRVLCQSSKESLLPEDYIAIVGDSYAQGLGDWLLDSNPNTNPPFHSAHVIHQRAKRDVITFGKSGAGSLQGLVGNPVSWIRYINLTRFSGLEEPEEIFVYFYEGNDLNDNLADIKARYFGRDYDPDSIYKKEFFSDFIAREVVDPLPSNGIPWLDQLFFTSFLKKVYDKNLEKEDEKKRIWEEGTINRVKVGGREIQIPDGLQSPALELSSAEMFLGMYVFKQSLAYLLRSFPGSRVAVVYIPAVLSSYEISSPFVSIQVYDKGRESVYESSRVRENGEKINRMVKQVAGELGVPFIDTRPAIRKAAREQILHGPKDWKHLNRLGYTIVAETVLTFRKNHSQPSL